MPTILMLTLVFILFCCSESYSNSARLLKVPNRANNKLLIRQMFGKDGKTPEKSLRTTAVDPPESSQTAVVGKQSGFSAVDVPYYAFLAYIAYLVLDSVRIIIMRSTEVPTPN